MRFTAIIAAASTAGLTFGAPAAQEPRGATYFNGQCRYLTLGGGLKTGQTTLDGQCVDGAGVWWTTSLNLNQCFGDGNGTLVYKVNGNFDSKCRPCELVDATEGDGIFLECDCADSTGYPHFTKMELGPDVDTSLAVKPVDGKLVCGNDDGSKVALK